MAKKRHNLNKRKSTNIVLLILALSFVAVPIVLFIFHIMAVNSTPWL